LIELLVVISIVALLVALLLPGLKGAKSAAKRVACGSTIRQIGTGVFTYAADSNAWTIPQYQSDVNPAGNSANDHASRWALRWPHTLNAVDTYSIFARYLGLSAPILHKLDPKIRCPGDTASLDWQRGWDNGYRVMGSYFYYGRHVGRAADGSGSTPDGFWDGALFFNNWDGAKVTSGQAEVRSLSVVAPLASQPGSPPLTLTSEFVPGRMALLADRIYRSPSGQAGGENHEATGGNSLFVDGHVYWAGFSKLKQTYFESTGGYFMLGYVP